MKVVYTSPPQTLVHGDLFFFAFPRRYRCPLTTSFEASFSYIPVGPGTGNFSPFFAWLSGCLHCLPRLFLLRPTCSGHQNTAVERFSEENADEDSGLDCMIKGHGEDYE